MELEERAVSHAEQAVTANGQWLTVGKMADLIPGAGVAALVNETQVAIFWVPELEQELLALSNYCPFSGVHIIARGIAGDINGEPVVASPLHKQHFSLLNGRCLEDPDVALRTWNVRLDGDSLQVQIPAEQGC